MGLRGREIPRFARIVGLADVYDALSTARAYKTSWPEVRVLEVIREESGGHFDPALVEILMDCVEDFREVRARYPD